MLIRPRADPRKITGIQVRHSISGRTESAENEEEKLGRITPSSPDCHENH